VSDFLNRYLHILLIAALLFGAAWSAASSFNKPKHVYLHAPKQLPYGASRAKSGISPVGNGRQDSHSAKREARRGDAYFTASLSGSTTDGL
jgi:hypothetical protein